MCWSVLRQHLVKGVKEYLYMIVCYSWCTQALDMLCLRLASNLGERDYLRSLTKVWIKKKFTILSQAFKFIESKYVHGLLSTHIIMTLSISKFVLDVRKKEHKTSLTFRNKKLYTQTVNTT